MEYEGLPRTTSISSAGFLSSGMTAINSTVGRSLTTRNSASWTPISVRGEARRMPDCGSTTAGRLLVPSSPDGTTIAASISGRMMDGEEPAPRGARVAGEAEMCCGSASSATCGHRERNQPSGPVGFARPHHRRTLELTRRMALLCSKHRASNLTHAHTLWQSSLS